MDKMRIFISSPSDVEAERNRADRVISRVSGGLGDGLTLEAVRWEDSYYTAAKDFQAQIVKPSETELVLCIFWKRLGSELPDGYNRSNGSARTGTEYEFEEALEGALKSNAKKPDIWVYRKTAPVTFEEASVDRERAEKRRVHAIDLTQLNRCSFDGLIVEEKATTNSGATIEDDVVRFFAAAEPMNFFRCKSASSDLN